MVLLEYASMFIDNRDPFLFASLIELAKSTMVISLEQVLFFIIPRLSLNDFNTILECSIFLLVCFCNCTRSVLRREYFESSLQTLLISLIRATCSSYEQATDLTRRIVDSWLNYSLSTRVYSMLRPYCPVFTGVLRRTIFLSLITYLLSIINA